MKKNKTPVNIKIAETDYDKTLVDIRNKGKCGLGQKIILLKLKQRLNLCV